MTTYIGDCSWLLIDERDARRPNDLPILRQVYEGRADQAETFRATKPVGLAISGGYITEVSKIVPQGPFATLEVTIALPPDFLAYKLSKSRMQQTSSKGATITASGIIPDESVIEGNRTISFIAPQATYSYFASSRPAGPRFTSPAESEDPILLRSIITATSGGKSRTFYGNAPSALATALAMPAVGLITGHTSEPIPGTPWFECQDTISYVYRGDDS